MLLATFGCGAVLSGEPITSDGSGDPTAPASTSSTTTATQAPPPGPTTSTSGGEPPLYDLPPQIPPSCDFFEQDCPEGQKCVPYSSEDAEAWEALRCVTVLPEAASGGQPCTVAGHPLSGFDNCNADSICWEVDELSLEGTCFDLCYGSQDNPICWSPDTSCLLANGPYGLCLELCDPLLQDCQGDHACYPGNDEYDFVCLIDESEGRGSPGATCESDPDCQAGSYCTSPELVPGCEGPVGCCTSFCDLSEPIPPCAPGQTCEPWVQEGDCLGQCDAGGCAALP